MTRGVFVPFRHRKKPVSKSEESSNTPASDIPINSHKTGALCSTCFDLNFAYVPQPQRNPAICSIGQPARHWISSVNLSSNVNCKSCCFLASAFDMLVSSLKATTTPGEAISYTIAIIDQNIPGEPGAASDQNISRRTPSLKVIMRCRLENVVNGNEGRFDEEFEVEIYTPLQGR